MTRETKVGLVVASSFICLVGVVVASKLRHGDLNASQTASTELAQNGKKESMDLFHQDKGGKSDPGKGGPNLAPAKFKVPSGVGDVRNDGPNLPGTLEVSTKPSDADPKPPSFPGVKDNNAGITLPAAPNFEDVHKKTKDALAQQVAQANPPLPPPAAEVPLPGSGKDVSLPQPPGAGPDAGPPSVGGLSVKKTEPKTDPGKGADNKPTDVIPGLPPPMPPSASNPSVPFSNPPSAPSPKPAAPSSADPPQPSKEPAPLPPPGAGLPPPPSSPFDSKGPTSTDSKPSSPFAAPDRPTSPTEKPKQPPLGANVPPPPLGANLGSTGGQPQVKSFSVNSYTIRPEDTSFAAISKQVFNTDKYGQALLLFNRDHPMAGNGVKQDPPRLEPGQKVFIPPTDYLDTRFASAIGKGPAPLGGSAPAVGSSTPPSFAPSSGFQPPAGFQPPVLGGSVTAPQPTAPSAPMATSGPGPLTVRTPPSTPTADPTRRYRVREQGQHIIEIARQTLGEGSRWSEIYRLNPTLQPAFPIPGGTEIQLPANAVVP